MDEDDITLRSGRGVYANCGILGISPRLEIAEGYDGYINEWGDRLTPDEVCELCDIAIDRWQRLKATVT